MTNTNNWKINKEHNITMCSLIRTILKKWKFILCCALIFGMIFAGYKYYKDLKTLNDLAITPIEKPALLPAEAEEIAYVKSLQNILDEQNQYIEESILLKINAYQENRVALQYQINGENGNDVLRLLEIFVSYIGNGGAVSDILASNEFDISAQYLQELIRASRTESAFDVFNDNPDRYFYVYVIGENSEMAEKLADSLEKVMESYGKTILGTSEQNLVLLARQNNVLYDMELEQTKNTLMFNRNSQTNTINTLVSQFSDAQKIAYNKESGEAHTKETIPTVKTSLDFTYFLVGIVIGIFLGSCWITCLYLLNNKVKSTVEIEKNCNVPVYGTLKAGSQYANHNIFEKKRILARLTLICAKKNLKNIIFTSGHEVSKEIISAKDLLWEGLRQQDIRFSFAENVLEQIELYKEFETSDAVILLVEINKTTYTVLEQVLSFLSENEMLLLGIIVID